MPKRLEKEQTKSRRMFINDICTSNLKFKYHKVNVLGMGHGGWWGQNKHVR